MREPTPQEIEQIESALAGGRKIEAIKLYRAATGCDLKDSKDAIDALIPQLREKDPARYAKLSQGAGCASLLLVCFGLAWLVTAMTSA